jgi:cytochrome oxidase Cu insertion factor (SCO1/SenC/PrrC family)
MSEPTPKPETPPETPPTQRVPETDEFPSGPGVGERLPDFTLPDQHGRAVNFTRAREGHRALVTFQRSVRW